jgi:hypothetical protein
MKLSRTKMITGCCVLLLARLLISPAISYSEEIEIDIAPNVLNIQSAGTVVTVHTDIAYWTVVGSTVLLNDVEIQSWKADNRGNFVAKFFMDAIKDLPLEIGDYNTLKLKGFDTGGQLFEGEQEIKVIDVVPAGR